jgi:hypothetical protein
MIFRGIFDRYEKDFAPRPAVWYALGDRIKQPISILPALYCQAGRVPASAITP